MIGREKMVSGCASRGSGKMLGKISSQRLCGRAVEWAAQGNGAVSVPGGS